MERTRLLVTEAGEVVIPVEIVEALGGQVGDVMVVTLEEDEARLFSIDSAIRGLQESVRRYVPNGVSLVDELIAERRAEAARE